MPFHRDIYLRKECSCSNTYNWNITCVDVYGQYLRTYHNQSTMHSSTMYSSTMYVAIVAKVLIV